MQSGHELNPPALINVFENIHVPAHGKNSVTSLIAGSKLAILFGLSVSWQVFGAALTSKRQ